MSSVPTSAMERHVVPMPAGAVTPVPVSRRRPLAAIRLFFVFVGRGLARLVGSYEALSVSFNLPPLISLSGKFAPVQAERQLSWDVYVELATRVTLRPLPERAGMREALTSIYRTLEFCRSSLHAAGPDCAPLRADGSTSAGQIVGVVANGVLAPFLSQWHAELAEWEGLCVSKAADGFTPRQIEQRWDRRAECVAAIARLQGDLREFAEQLRLIARVPSLLALPVVDLDDAAVPVEALR